MDLDLMGQDGLGHNQEPNSGGFKNNLQDPSHRVRYELGS